MPFSSPHLQRAVHRLSRALAVAARQPKLDSPQPHLHGAVAAGAVLNASLPEALCIAQGWPKRSALRLPWLAAPCCAALCCAALCCAALCCAALCCAALCCAVLCLTSGFSLNLRVMAFRHCSTRLSFCGRQGGAQTAWPGYFTAVAMSHTRQCRESSGQPCSRPCSAQAVFSAHAATALP